MARVTQHQARTLREQLLSVDSLAAAIADSGRLELLPVLRREAQLALDVIADKPDRHPDPETARAALRIHVSAFIDQCCVLGDDRSIDATSLFDAFASWYRENLPNAGPISQKQVGRIFRERFRYQKKGIYVYLGIGLREERQSKQQSLE